MTNMIKSLFISGCTALILALTATDSIAQQITNMPQMAQPKEYSDAELHMFADATLDVQKVQMAFQQKVLDAAQAEGMDPMQFQQMAQAQQSGKESAMEYTAEDQKMFESVMKKVMEMQDAVQADIEAKLNEHNISMQQYQTMSMSIRQSPEMTEKVQDFMRGL